MGRHGCNGLGREMNSVPEVRHVLGDLEWASHAVIQETSGCHLAGLEEIPAVDNDRLFHDGAELLQVEFGELLPFGQDEERVAP